MCVTANGCTESSDRVCSCKWHHQGQLKADYSFELGIREKALAMETHFPNPDVSIILGEDNIYKKRKIGNLLKG